MGDFKAWLIGAEGGLDPVAPGRDRKHPFELIADDLVEALGQRAGAGLAEALHANTDAVWLLLDGLDEVIGADLKRVRRLIETYAKQLPNAPIVVLSRPIGYERLIGFERARVRTLDTEQQRALLGKWLKAPERAAQAWARIQASPTLSEIAAFPLLLTLIAIVFREEGEVPPTRAEVYRQALDVLVSKGHCPTDPQPMPAPRAARRVLQQLSLYLQRIGGEAWPADEVARALRLLEGGEVGADEALWHALHGLNEDDIAADRREVEPESREGFLDVLAANSGIIGPHDGTNADWRYLHRALRDALCAELLAKRSTEQVVELAETLANRKGPGVGRWAETFGLMCAASSDPTRLLRALQTPAPAMVRRAIAEVDGLAPRAALDILMGTHGWDAEDVLRLARRWPVDDLRFIRDLAHPKVDLETIAWVHYVLSRLGALPADFFEAVGRPRKAEVELPEWVTIEAASALIGSSEHPEEQPQHTIDLARYALGKTTVTNRQFAQLAPEHRQPDGPAHPVTRVSWYGARLFAVWAGARLPTEAEWEHACRAGTTTRWSSGDNEAELSKYAWFDPTDRPMRVGKKRPNGWALHDMHGNVWEWCHDWYGPYPKPGPMGPPDGVVRAMRGGSARNPAVRCRSASRSMDSPTERFGSIGFRLARSAPPEGEG